MNQGTPGDTCIAVSQNSLDSLSSLATAILGPGATLTTVTLSPSSVPTSSLFSSSESSSTTNSTPVATGSSNSASTSSSTIPPVSTLAPTTTSSTSAVQTSSIGSIPSPTPTPTPSPLGSSSNSHHHLSTPALVGTIVGVILGLASISVSCCAFYTRFPRSGRGKRSTSSEGDLRGGYLGLWRRAELRTPLTV
ncbi:hypothetical protein N431DRAFT_424754 [Stipitochalara longipes BDJ]|nr:hypothetical protein N431DRAFT_424754 [Stipitochalara longipes BDJ]